MFEGSLNKHFFNIVLYFSPDTFRWSTPAVTGCIPPARDGHSACVIGKKIFIFGGYEQRVSFFKPSLTSE